MNDPARTILIVEDEHQLARAVREAFETRGFSPLSVSSVTDAVAKLEEFGPVAAVWLDHYLLGHGDGLDFVVTVKNDPRFKEMPIFVVSNTASSSNIRSYIALGVNNYYTKADYDINQIINDIEYTLAEHRSAAPAA